MDVVFVSAPRPSGKYGLAVATCIHGCGGGAGRQEHICLAVATVYTVTEEARAGKKQIV